MLISSKSCSYPISCNFPPLPFLSKTQTQRTQSITFNPTTILTTLNPAASTSSTRKVLFLPLCRDSTQGGNSQTPTEEIKVVSLETTTVVDGGEGGGGGGDYDWSTSALLFVFWAALIFYVFQLTPNQTPIRDMYFLQKLLNLKGDDGFRMNEILVGLWYVMGLWPLVYSMLLLPTGRSSRSKIPVWPFLVLSCFGGAYALIPYFVLWKPPPPAVGEDEISRWPLNFLESKITAVVSLAAGIGIITYAGLAGGDSWREFYQYFRESKFIHVTCLDFSLLSAFAPFWVYNDMTARKWIDRGSWLLLVALVPFLGPALYVLLRPPLSALPTRVGINTPEEDYD